MVGAWARNMRSQVLPSSCSICAENRLVLDSPRLGIFRLLALVALAIKSMQDSSAGRLHCRILNSMDQKFTTERNFYLVVTEYYDIRTVALYSMRTESEHLCRFLLMECFLGLKFTRIAR